jgi:hypothetical protein
MRGTELTKDAPSIKAAILAKLMAAPELSAIKKWLKAEPVPTRYPTSPFGWVEYNGGLRAPSSGTKQVNDDFFVVIVVKSADPDNNEDTAMALAKSAEAALEANPQLSSTTFDSYVSNREKQKVFASDYDIVAIRLTVHTWRFS